MASGLRRLLIAAPFAPRLDGMDGGSRVMAQQIAALAERHAIALVYLRGRGDLVIDPSTARVCDIVSEVARPWSVSGGRTSKAFRLGTGLIAGTPLWARRWWSPACAERIREIAVRWRPHVAQFEFHIMGQYATALAGLPVARVLVQHEPGAAAAADRRARARGASRLAAAADHHAWVRYERRTMRMFDRIVAFTDRDVGVLRALDPVTSIVRIPFGIRLPAVPLSAEGTGRPTILFVGSFAHAPNEDAAVRLAADILPLVHRTHPGAALNLVGSYPTARVLSLQGPRIEVYGSVPDVEPYLRRAAVVAVPLRFGGGMRVKVLEGLASGKALVCSRLAVNGMDVNDREHVYLADTDGDFAKQIAVLLASPERRRELGSRARRWASVHATAERAAAAYEQLYASLSALYAVDTPSPPAAQGVH